MIVKVKGEVPEYKTEGSAGADLRLDMSKVQGRKGICGDVIHIYPNEIIMLPTDTRIEFPIGYYGEVFLRSSIGMEGLIMPSTGVIDND